MENARPSMATVPPALVDGVASSAVAVDDRGLAFGDGVFETIAVVAGRPALWDEHLKRLRAGCRALGFPPPSCAELEGDAHSLFPPGEPGSGVLKLIVTRGSGGHGYAAPAKANPRRIALRRTPPEPPAAWWSDGVVLYPCRTRVTDRPPLAGVKHLNRLPQVVARSEWRGTEVFAEGLMRDESGNAVECTACNLFARFGDRLVTPPRDCLAVAGVMRAEIMGRAGVRGIEVVERTLPLADLQSADEVFVTNSIVGILPVRAMADSRWKPGVLASSLLTELIADATVLDWRKGAAEPCAD